MHGGARDRYIKTEKIGEGKYGGSRYQGQPVFTTFCCTSEDKLEAADEVRVPRMYVTAMRRLQSTTYYVVWIPEYQTYVYDIMIVVVSCAPSSQQCLPYRYLLVFNTK